MKTASNGMSHSFTQESKVRSVANSRNTQGKPLISTAEVRMTILTTLLLVVLLMASYLNGGLFMKEILSASVIIGIVIALRLNEQKLTN